MKHVVLFLGLLLTGCATLGFGDFDSSSESENNQMLLSSEEGIPVKFTYQPLIGGKHEIIKTSRKTWCINTRYGSSSQYIHCRGGGH